MPNAIANAMVQRFRLRSTSEPPPSGPAPLHNGKTYDNRYHFAIDLRDGRVAAVREYMDSHHVVVTMPPPPGT